MNLNFADTNSIPSSLHQNVELTKASSLSPELVRPYAKAPIKNNTTSRRQGKSRIYTNTPEKYRLVSLEKEKTLKKERIEATKKRKIMKSLFTPPKKAPPKKLKREQSSSSEFDVSVKINDGSSEDSEPDEIPVLSVNYEITVGDFIIVRFATKSTAVHYIGEVTNG
ncbi:hypothetical protein MML48_2g00013126 [Holotrichia oblita]|uniref:Uncharacterized protein n=1 Tax=Holotrichia oblita TaxID=644536 RepID=A0ACB9TMB9_HOLOL|nr:hypothetical protein MML48_2g00013126 [Holotrichia oblita]